MRVTLLQAPPPAGIEPLPASQRQRGNRNQQPQTLPPGSRRLDVSHAGRGGLISFSGIMPTNYKQLPKPARMPASAASVRRILLKPNARALSAMRACGTNIGVAVERRGLRYRADRINSAGLHCRRHCQRIKLTILPGSDQPGLLFRCQIRVYPDASKRGQPEVRQRIHH